MHVLATAPSLPQATSARSAARALGPIAVISLASHHPAARPRRNRSISTLEGSDVTPPTPPVNYSRGLGRCRCGVLHVRVGSDGDWSNKTELPRHCLGGSRDAAPPAARVYLACVALLIFVRGFLSRIARVTAMGNTWRCVVLELQLNVVGSRDRI